MQDLLFLNIGTQEVVVLFVMAVAGFAPLILAIIALIDIFKRDFENKSTDKILLILLVLVVPFIGSIIYLLALRKSYPLLHKETNV